jgi:hypothetical protein
MSTLTSNIDSEDKNRRMRMENVRALGRLFGTAPDLVWMYRKTHATAPNRDSAEFAMTEAAGIVQEVLWSETFSGKGSHAAHRETQALSAKYLSNPSLHCRALRDFFIAHLVLQLREQCRVKPSQFWGLGISAGLAAFWYGHLTHRSESAGGYVNLAYDWLSVAVEYASAIILYVFIRCGSRIWREVSKGSVLEASLSDVRISYFDEPTIIERLRSLEGRTFLIPSVLYSLLKQHTASLADFEHSEAWRALPGERKNAIFAEQNRWLTSMTSYDER